MPTAFIALQCYQCSTMQVKQQKKSSNKWCCVVCNAKQSVTKIFARALMAKEVRFFVQNFNMSRLAADRKIANNPIPESPQYNGTRNLEFKKKRTDWSEYVDAEDENLVVDDDEEKGNAFEPKVVTELPKELFTRPKLKNALKLSCNNEKGFKPVFQKRGNIKKRTHPGEFTEIEPNESQQITQHGSDESTGNTMVLGKEDTKFQQSRGPVRRKGYENQNRDDNYEIYEMTRQQKMTSKVAFRCSGNTVEYGHSGGNGDFPEKQNGKSQFAAIALKFNRNGFQHEKGTESLEVTRQQKKATIVSKWNDYITEDDEAGCYSGILQRESCRDLSDPTNHWKSDMFEMNLGDQKVEEDVHPDFL